VTSDVANQSPRQELEAYLAAPPEDIDNIVVYVFFSYIFICCEADINTLSKHHSVQFPTLARIAKDYLAIQGSTVASERSFSSGGITGTTHRNSLLPKTFEALQLLKSAYCQGHISATAQAELAAPQNDAVIDDE